VTLFHAIPCLPMTACFYLASRIFTLAFCVIPKKEHVEEASVVDPDSLNPDPDPGF